MRLDYHNSISRSEAIRKHLPNLQLLLCEPPAGHSHTAYQNGVRRFASLAFMTMLGEGFLEGPDCFDGRSREIVNACCPLSLNLTVSISRPKTLHYEYHLDVDKFKKDLSTHKQMQVHKMIEQALREASMWSAVVTHCSIRLNVTLTLDRASGNDLKLWQDMAQDKQTERQFHNVTWTQRSLEIRLRSPPACGISLKYWVLVKSIYYCLEALETAHHHCATPTSIKAL